MSNRAPYPNFIVNFEVAPSIQHLGFVARATVRVGQKQKYIAILLDSPLQYEDRLVERFWRYLGAL